MLPRRRRKMIAIRKRKRKQSSQITSQDMSQSGSRYPFLTNPLDGSGGQEEIEVHPPNMGYNVLQRSEICKRTTVIVICAVLIGLSLTFGILFGLVKQNEECSKNVAAHGGNRKRVCCRGLQSSFLPWTYSCENGQCVKKSGMPTAKSQLLSTCKLTCGKYGGIWPGPRNKSVIGNTTVSIIYSSITLNKLTCSGKVCGIDVSNLMKEAFSFFLNSTASFCANDDAIMDPAKCSAETQTNAVPVTITVKSQSIKISLETSEAYSLSIGTSNGKVSVGINADNFFGARHALETLSQLISYDMLSDSLQIVSSAEIVDSPAFPYRGILLDTSRNFFSVKSILKLLDAMSYNKLNTFHWHITDTHSFPIVIEKQENMTIYGAYSEKQKYSVSDVKKIINRAAVRGIRILPEFDQPAHAGNGWQWGEAAGLGKMAFCVNQEPWQSYCVEPPCGQLNPLNNNMYEVLKVIYKDYLDRFQPDLFHFGGDEVNVGCWNTSQEIIDWMKEKGKMRTEEDFMDLWNMFLVNATNGFKSQTKEDIPLIVWSSKMTDNKHLTKYLNNRTYIVHLWNSATDKSIPYILNNGFKVILSNYDHTYLDCGFGSWVADGNNWCSPYKQWQLQYNLNPIKMLGYFNMTQERLGQILGGETNMWSEQVDENSLEMKIWPRSAALAERMWSNPSSSWKAAEQRLMHHRQRLVDRGIQADALKPLWCYQNSGMCTG